MIQEIKSNEINQNKDFVNLHQSNKKRRFNEINTINLSRDDNTNTNIPLNRLRRIIMTTNFHSLVSDDEAQKFLNELQVRPKEDFKEFVKKYISGFISMIFLNLGEKIKSKKIEDENSKKEIEEDVKKINENLIESNMELKKCVVAVYKDREVIFLLL